MNMLDYKISYDHIISNEEKDESVSYLFVLLVNFGLFKIR